MKLTDQEERVLKDIPSKWFDPDELPVHYHGRDSICRRLKKKGVFESRLKASAKESINRGEGVPLSPVEYRLMASKK